MARQFAIAVHASGTTVCATVFDHDGRQVARDVAPLTPVSPRPGWAEYDARELTGCLEALLPALIRDVSIDLGHYAAVGLATQPGTAVLWDRHTGQPICNAIAATCQRSRELCKDLLGLGLGDVVRERTGLSLTPNGAGPNVAWALDNVADARARAEAGDLLFGTVDTWLIYHLTGGRAHVTDHTSTGRTMLYNIHTKAWDQDLLDALRIPAHLLPSIRSSSEAYAESSGTGDTPAGLLIGGAAAECQAALFGQLCHGRGSARVRYGRDCLSQLNTGQDAVAPTTKLLTVPACGPAGNPVYALEGRAPNAGAAVELLRRPLGLIADAAETAPLAGATPDSGGVTFVPGLDGDAAEQPNTGALLGLSAETTRAQLARAALEGTANSAADLLEAMADDAGLDVAALRVDGPGARNDFLLQLQADLLDLPVERPANLDTAPLGAAFLAGLASGFWLDADDLAQRLEIGHTFRPHMSPQDRRRARARWHEALNRLR